MKGWGRGRGRGKRLAELEEPPKPVQHLFQSKGGSVEDSQPVARPPTPVPAQFQDAYEEQLPVEMRRPLGVCPLNTKIYSEFENVDSKVPLRCTSSWICSPDEIVLLTAESFFERADLFVSAMSRFYWMQEVDIGPRMVPDIDVVKPGSVLAAEHEGMWHRALVEEVSRESSTYEVFTLDTGDFFRVHAGSCRFLREEFNFGYVAAMAVRTCLPEVKRFWTEIAQEGSLDDWNYAVTKILLKVLRNQNFFVTFVKKERGKLGDLLWEINIQRLEWPTREYPANRNIVEDILWKCMAGNSLWRKTIKDRQLAEDVKDMRLDKVRKFQKAGFHVEY